MEKLTHKEFLNKVLKNNPHYKNGLFKIVSKYKGYTEPIYLKNKYGCLKTTPYSLIEKSFKGSIKTAINKKKYLIKRFKEVHGDCYDYSLVEYKGTKKDIKIKCKKHGVFEQTSSNHCKGKGCPKCAIEATKERMSHTTEWFLEKAKKVHKDRYRYGDSIYKGINEPIKIFCKKHGIFEQSPYRHVIKKHGCKKCADENLKWRYTDWEKLGNSSKDFESFKIYIIKCWSEEESFYKIGKTFKNMYKRFCISKCVAMPYNWEPIFIFEGNAIEISKMEKEYQNLNRNYKYSPKISFGGSGECYFSIKNLENCLS